MNYVHNEYCSSEKDLIIWANKCPTNICPLVCLLWGCQDF